MGSRRNSSICPSSKCFHDSADLAHRSLICDTFLDMESSLLSVICKCKRPYLSSNSIHHCAKCIYLDTVSGRTDTSLFSDGEVELALGST